MQVSLRDDSRSKNCQAERNTWNNVSSAYSKVSTGIPERCTQEAPVRQNEGHRESKRTIAANKERGETDESKRLRHKRRKLVFRACIGLRDRGNHRNTDCRWDES